MNLVVCLRFSPFMVGVQLQHNLVFFLHTEWIPLFLFFLSLSKRSLFSFLFIWIFQLFICKRSTVANVNKTLCGGAIAPRTCYHVIYHSIHVAALCLPKKLQLDAIQAIGTHAIRKFRCKQNSIAFRCSRQMTELHSLPWAIDD